MKEEKTNREDYNIFKYIKAAMKKQTIELLVLWTSKNLSRQQEVPDQILGKNLFVFLLPF